MALMLHREPNQVRWVGVRPGHNGEQVAKSVSATNATVILHTVTAGKTLFVVHANLVMYATLASLAALLTVRNGADVGQYSIATLVSGVAGHQNLPADFNPPLEIPAGWDIIVVSNGAACNGYGFIFGWEE